MDSNPTVCEEKFTSNPNERGDLLRNKVDTIAFRIC